MKIKVVEVIGRTEGPTTTTILAKVNVLLEDSSDVFYVVYDERRGVAKGRFFTIFICAVTYYKTFTSFEAPQLDPGHRMGKDLFEAIA